MADAPSASPPAAPTVPPVVGLLGPWGKIAAVAGKAYDGLKNAKDKAVEGAKYSWSSLKESWKKPEQVGYAAAPKELTTKQKFTQPVVILTMAVFLSFFLWFSNQGTLAAYVLIAAFFSTIFNIIFKEPRKGYVGLSFPFFIWILETLNMYTPANVALAAGLSLTLILVTFENAREWAAKVLSVFFFVAGGVLIFVMSTWAQMLLEIKFPFIITSSFLLAYFIFILTRKGKLKWIALIINVFFLIILFSLPAVFCATDSPLCQAAAAQRNGVASVFTYGLDVFRQFFKGVQTQILVATGDYEAGVEAQSEKPLGVFLDNVGSTASIVRVGDKNIDVYGRLRVESFKTNEKVLVKVKCYVEGMERRTKGKITPDENFTVEEYEMRDIDCIMPVSGTGGPGVGTPTIVLEASFDFATSAYLKSYFMEQDTVRSLRRREIDPLDSFKITDKNPAAIFTGGPMMVGMGAGQQPVALVSTEQYGPTLTITFDKNWGDGEFKNISRLNITIPPGLALHDVDGYTPPPNSCLGEEDGEQNCVFDGEFLEDVLKTGVWGDYSIVPRTLRVHTVLVQDGVKTLLGSAPLAVRSFKVNVKYNYVIKKKVEVTVREQEAPK